MPYHSTSNPKPQIDKRKELRNSSTPAEAALWRLLKSCQIGGYKFRRQHGLGPYVMDFYCPTLRLCIELDGASHDSDSAFDHDEARTAFLNINGITVLRFENVVVWKNSEAIINAILDFAKNKFNNSPQP